jgi:hypothetical protein
MSATPWNGKHGMRCAVDDCPYRAEVATVLCCNHEQIKLHTETDRLRAQLAAAQAQAEEYKAEAERLRGAFEKEAASIAVEWGLSGEIVLQGIKFLIRRDEETSETTAEALP